MRLVGRVDHVGSVNVAAIFLADAGEDALGAGTLHTDTDAGKFLLECFGQPLRKRQIHGGVEGELAFLLGRLDERRRDRLGSHSGRLRARRPRQLARGERPCKCRRCVEQLPSG